MNKNINAGKPVVYVSGTKLVVLSFISGMAVLPAAIAGTAVYVIIRSHIREEKKKRHQKGE